MTTRQEIDVWSRPFINLHPEMVRASHLLVFSPVYHVMRALEFLASSYRTSPNVRWTLAPMFIPPNLLSQFGNDIPVGRSDWPGFRETLDERGEAAIASYLIPHKTIADFHRVAQKREPAAFFFGDFRYFPRQHAIVLAALGRFEEAEALLLEPLAKLEASVAAQLEEGRSLVAKRPRSKSGKFLLENGERDAGLAVQLSQLLTSLQRRDASTIAALLHEWEAENVARWNVAHLWQPTPFPFESA